MSIIPFDDRDGYIWLNGEMMPWRECKTHVISHGLHYASLVFEGERAYNGKIFKSIDHTNRLFNSAKILDFEIPWSLEKIEDTKLELLETMKLSNSYVRVEVICDRKGFWLKPHCDIKEKLMSCLLFVNKHNEKEDLGTDFYDENLKLAKTVPYKDNYGYFFSSGPNTWHGMEKKEIVKERRCLQVNYVTFETDWKVN